MFWKFAMVEVIFTDTVE
jgi:hypothetical protein